MFLPSLMLKELYAKYSYQLDTHKAVWKCSKGYTIKLDEIDLTFPPAIHGKCDIVPPYTTLSVKGVENTLITCVFIW